MATFIEDLGIVSAYGEAVSKGYTGTEEEFAEMLANLPDKLAEAREYATSAAESSASAASSADGVQRNASIASTAASDAQSAAASALQSATFAETTVEGIEEHEEQCRIYRAEAVAAAEELKTTTLWNDALIDETVTGKIASFSDGCAGMPMKSIVVEITPVQSGSGDPSPTNIRPISGRTGLTVTAAGKNLCSGFNNYNQNSKVTPIMRLSGGIAYTFSCNSTLNINCIYVRKGPTISISATAIKTVYDATTVTFTPPETGDYFIQVYKSGDGWTTEPTNVQLEIGASATAYEPYTAQTYPITWQTEAGTVYGGTLDVVSGVLTVTHVFVSLFGIQYYWQRSGTYNGSFYISAANFANEYNVPLIKTFAPFVCSHAKTAEKTADYQFGGCYMDSSLSLWLLPADSTVDDFRNYLNAQVTAGTPVQVCCELETPQTYQLTPTEVRTILGENLVYSDADDVTVNYYVDMKGYIDKRLNTTRMMIAGVETSFVATKNYAIGDFVIVNDTLYRITAVITSGETITPGTNASETTVAEQLIALYNA